MKAKDMIIKLEDEDIPEMAEHQLKVINEEGMRQESDDGDNDDDDGKNLYDEDPDDDLDF